MTELGPETAWWNLLNGAAGAADRLKRAEWWRPRAESTADLPLRRRLLYPLSYEVTAPV